MGASMQMNNSAIGTVRRGDDISANRAGMSWEGCIAIVEVSENR